MPISDVVIEVFRGVVLTGVVGYLWHAGRAKGFSATIGWRLILLGFGLVLFGTILDITDNFDELNRFVVIGDTDTEAFLEKVIGYLLGFVVIAIGLLKWIPTIDTFQNEQALHDETVSRLYQSERALVEAQRVAKIGSWWLNPETGELHWTDEIFRIFGRVPGEFTPTEDRFYETVHPEDREAVKASADAAVQAQRPHSIDHRILLPSGEVRWVHEEAVSEIDESGTLTLLAGTVQDITDRKLAELALHKLNDELESRVERRTQELAKSEQRLSGHIENTPLGVVAWNEHFECTLWNPAAERIFGYAREEALGVNALKLLVPEALHDQIDGVFEHTMQAGGSHSINENTTKDGRTILCEWTNTPLTDESGAPIGVASIVQDITEQERNREKIRESEARFRAIVENAGDAIYIHDRYGTIHEVNSIATEQTGYTREELLDLSVAALNAGMPFDELRETWDLGVVDPDAYPMTLENEMRRKDGSVFPVEVRISLIVGENEEQLFVAMLRDISERKAADAEVLKAKELAEERSRELEEITSDFVAILDYSSDFLYIKDASYRYRVTNQKFAELTNHSHWSELAGKFDSEIFPAEHAEAYRQDDRMVIEKGQPVMGRLEEYPKKDGSKGWVLSNKHPIRDKDGQIIAMFGFSTDVSELIEARNAAQAANYSKSAFLANMSHEIRTPMNGVVGMAEILSRTDLSVPQANMLRTIRASSESLLRIIDDILDLSKIEAGKMSLELEATDIEDAIEGVMEAMRPTALSSGVRLYLYYDPTLPNFIKTDPIRFRQILTNLLGNAVKFSSKKEGQPNGQVHLRVKMTDDRQIAIEVTDHGVGMSDEVLGRLFQPFYQGEESTTRVYGGTGLGLVITKTLVEMMGGDISASSTLGQGSTFSVRLPIKQADGERVEADVSDLVVIGMAETPELQEMLTTQCAHFCADLRLGQTVEEVESFLAESTGQSIVLLGMETAEANLDLRRRLSKASDNVRFLNFCMDRFELGTCTLPDCYNVQYYPLLPSQLRHGIAVLAGRASPDVEYHQAQAEDVSTPDPAEEIIHRLLLVEDNKTNQEVITTQLKMLGYGVEVADNGVQGLAKWTDGNYDLVLADCHMPEMDGFEMTANIRNAEESRGLSRTPIIAITANALKGEAERCFAAGMDDFLSKPVTLVELKEVLAKALPRP